MYKKTFMEFLHEMSSAIDDEDLSSDDLKKKAAILLKRAQLKSTGRDDQANKDALRELQQKMNATTDPQQKSDIQRRIKELMNPVAK